MRLFKTASAAQLAEDYAAGARLNAVVGRGQAELESYSAYPEAANGSAVRQRFWTPDELAEDDRSD